MTSDSVVVAKLPYAAISKSSFVTFDLQPSLPRLSPTHQLCCVDGECPSLLCLLTTVTPRLLQTIEASMNFQSVRMNQDGSDQQGVARGSGESGLPTKSSTAAIPKTASESDNVLGSSLAEHGGKGDLSCQLDSTSTRNGHRVNGCYTVPTPPPSIPTTTTTTTSSSNMSNGLVPTPVAEGGSSCNASHSSEAESELKKKSSVKKDRKALRKGKWTVRT